MSAAKTPSSQKNNIPGVDDIPKYILMLFVSGLMPNSINAIKNIKEICTQNLKGKYQLDVIDIYQQPDLAIIEQIVVLPVLIIKKPIPEQRIIGDLSNRQKVLDTINFYA